VLSDGEKKPIYDLEGIEGLEAHEKGGQRGGGGMSPFDMFFGGGQQGGRRKGPDASVDIEVTLEDLYNGGQRQARISRNVICNKCKGSGAKDGQTSACHACQGRGHRMVQQQMAPGFVVQMQETCSECGGKGKIAKSKCPQCSGNKVLMEEKTLTAQIERGMPSNAEIRFERESEQQPGMTPGDVVFKLKQAAHTRFRREGDDLHMSLHLSLKEALLGFDRTFRHLDGREVNLKHKGVTQPFEVRKVSSVPPTRLRPSLTLLPPPFVPAGRERGHAPARHALRARGAARQVHP
jgi:DnaJ-related protein SCJ1